MPVRYETKLQLPIQNLNLLGRLVQARARQRLVMLCTTQQLRSQDGAGSAFKPGPAPWQEAGMPMTDDVHYRLGQTIPYWSLDQVKNPIGTFSLVFKSPPSTDRAENRFDKTWFIVALLESEGVAIERVLERIPSSGNDGLIHFELRHKKNTIALYGQYNNQDDTLEVCYYTKDAKLVEKPENKSRRKSVKKVEVLELLWLEDQAKVTVVTNEMHEVMSLL
ncbi:hypothetical protein FB446DRAFT_429358 [Lentinula raphanica]|nr:hypothetical protein FB446DRAFT_429358 [Lentinula raphanica]